MADTKKKKSKKTTSKKSNSTKKSTTKKTTSVKKVVPIENEEKIVEVKEVKIVNEDLEDTQPLLKVEEDKIEVVEENIIDNDVENESVNEIALEEIIEVKELERPIKKEEKIQETVENKKIEKIIQKDNKLMDAGILVVLIGMFILVLITYITSAFNLNYLITNILVGISLLIEAVGIIVIIISLGKKK